MKFGKYQTAWDLVKGLQNTTDSLSFYRSLLEYAFESNRFRDNGAFNEAASEACWYVKKRPYYRIWPCVAEASLRTRLDIPNDVLIGAGPMLVSVEVPDVPCFSKFNEGKLTSILLCLNQKRMDGATLGLAIPSVAGARSYYNLYAQFDCDRNETYLSEGPLMDGRTIEEDLIAPIRKSFKPRSAGLSEEADFAVARIALVVASLACTNSDIVTPDLLPKHKKWLGTDRQWEFHEKAKRRGKNGFDVGRELQEQIDRSEVSPHFRAPHFATVWTGKGKKIPKFVFRTGEGGGPILVKGKKLTEVPTGYYGNEESA